MCPEILCTPLCRGLGAIRGGLKKNRKRTYVITKGIVLNVVRCVSKEDTLEYARIFSVIVGVVKEP